MYYGATTFDKACISVDVSNGAPLDVVAIDHLPTMIPAEASESFCSDLVPFLLQLQEGSAVWSDAEHLFYEKVKEIKAKQ